MVVHNLDFRWSCGSPNKTDPILIVDADAVLADSVTFERFKPVAWGNPEVVEPSSDLKLPQLSAGCRLESGKSLDTPATGQGLGIGVTERDDYWQILTPRRHTVKRYYSCWRATCS